MNHVAYHDQHSFSPSSRSHSEKPTAYNVHHKTGGWIGMGVNPTEAEEIIEKDMKEEWDDNLKYEDYTITPIYS